MLCSPAASLCIEPPPPFPDNTPLKTHESALLLHRLSGVRVSKLAERRREGSLTTEFCCDGERISEKSLLSGAAALQLRARKEGQLQSTGFSSLKMHVRN